MYLVEKNINRLEKLGSTLFLDPSEARQVKSKLKKDMYKEYKPYVDSEKVILYREIPNILLYEIKCKNRLKHQDIMGSLLNLNLDKSLFGDILIIDDKYYFYVFEYVYKEIENNFNKISRYNITIERCDLKLLENYTRNYEEIEVIVSSLRIDTVISRLLNINRNKIKDLIKDKSIMLNYELLKNNSYVVKEDDICSIRRYGKFKYINIIKNTKSNHYIIKVLKYI
jgi:RNA-binding protein YlmH